MMEAVVYQVLNPFSRANPDRRLLFPVWCAVDGIGLQTAILAPWLVGVYIANYHFSVADAGLLMSIEFTALALVSVAISPFIDRIPRDKLAISGAVLVLVCNASCLFVESWSAFLVTRTLAGVGHGLAMTAGNAAAASAKNPAQLYGHKLAFLGLMTLTTMLLIPTLIENFSPKWLFGVMMLFNAALIYPLRKLPRYPEAVSQADAASDIGPPLLSPARAIGVVMFIAVLTFFTRDTMVFVFSERIGVDLGITRELIGLALAVSGIVGISGPLLAVWLGHRFGQLKPAVVVLMLSAWLTHTLVLTLNPWIFAAMIVIWPVLNLGGFALLMGLAGILDPRGRLISACGGAVLAAYAISPVFSSYVLEQGGKQALAGVLLACAVATGVALLVVHRLSGPRGSSLRPTGVTVD